MSCHPCDRNQQPRAERGDLASGSEILTSTFALRATVDNLHMEWLANRSFRYGCHAKSEGWSGREDLNLRPLGPESLQSITFPKRITRLSIGSR